MAKYDYADFLEVDADTYQEWLPKIARIESEAIMRIKMLMSSENKTAYVDSQKYMQEHAYCEERIYMAFYGDEIGSTLFNYHQDHIAILEDSFKYQNIEVES